MKTTKTTEKDMERRIDQALYVLEGIPEEDLRAAAQLPPGERLRRLAGIGSPSMALDAHQTRMVAFLRERLGGTTDEVLEFLVTAGLYALQLDEFADSRVDDGVVAIFEGTEIAKKVMEGIRETECEVRLDVVEFLGKMWRPRMAGDWRGEPLPDEPEAAPAEA